MKRLISILGLAILILFPALAQEVSKKISLESIYKQRRFYPFTISNIRSMNDGLHYTIMSENKYIEKHSYETGDFVNFLLDLSRLENAGITNFSGYEFSSDESKILLTTGRESIYRHSYKADYFVFDRNSSKLTPLSENGKQQLATFSPDGNSIAFVRNNNVFIKNLESETEIQITIDGEYNKIINGAPDWVYEEEFGFTKAFAWSPDSKRIAFYRFDETNVRQFNMTLYESLYPEWYKYKYPKAGEENAVVEIWVVNLEDRKFTKINTGKNKDQYIPRIKWTMNPEVLSVVRLNRLQNHLEIIHANAKTGESEIVYSEKEDQYISEVSDDMITYLDNEEEFIIKSERDNFSHFYLYNFIEKTIKPITSGEFDVCSFLGFDKKNSILYYTSHERAPRDLDIYRINIRNGRKSRLSKKTGWNTAVFSNNFEYFIHTYSNINQAPLYSLNNNKGKLIRLLEDNNELNARMKEYDFAQATFFNFTTSDNIELEGYMIKPNHFNPENKYPVFMYVYGGPESQNVKNDFSYRIPWFQYLAQQGYIVVCVDNRGTDARGEEFRKSTYMQLGKLETIDQIEAAKYLGNLPYVDKERIGIFGWSYGGYMSLSCLFKGPEYFKMAISVAPVTNWRFYDTIYTERFMRTPRENPDGYDKNSPIHYVDGLKGKLLLVHGMGDDNVHFQNSTELVKSLVDSDKQFEMLFYPNKNHRISGGNTTFHLYTRMTEFVLENL